ncbi:MAG: hypothetical protein EVJ47_06580 [Candidatus Acidulodesulfobacterium ferriphilum]|jgi:hypothetical protein|uniref:Lipoprotein n=1 Tax=Candidatus Acidulodesulfobacterium ferriphilum TaxID=2597223 RepID=A0A519BAV9_9DELT|nr:MAG: hypothetical protein EVJ47_06580 [Candidatus Acidulodesulfobacterium ferriphilum]
MKKLILIAGIIITGLALSGCAKNPAMVYHRYSYYTKHHKQAYRVYAACKKIPDFVNQKKSINFDVSKENKNCFNAYYNIFFHFQGRGYVH